MLTCWWCSGKSPRCCRSCSLGPPPRGTAAVGRTCCCLTCCRRSRWRRRCRWVEGPAGSPGCCGTNRPAAGQPSSGCGQADPRGRGSERPSSPLSSCTSPQCENRENLFFCSKFICCCLSSQQSPDDERKNFSFISVGPAWIISADSWKPGRLFQVSYMADGDLKPLRAVLLLFSSSWPLHSSPSLSAWADIPTEALLAPCGPRHQVPPTSGPPAFHPMRATI